MTRILVVHGLGMEMRGKTQLDVFGPMLLSEYDEHIRGYASELGADVEIFHSNVEEEVIDKFRKSEADGFDAALINPSGYTTGHPDLSAAIKNVKFPTFEIHISNPASRGRVSEIAPVCKGVITGSGIFGYYLGMRAAINATSD